MRPEATALLPMALNQGCLSLNPAQAGFKRSPSPWSLKISRPALGLITGGTDTARGRRGAQCRLWVPQRWARPPDGHLCHSLWGPVPVQLHSSQDTILFSLCLGGAGDRKPHLGKRKRTAREKSLVPSTAGATATAGSSVYSSPERRASSPVVLTSWVENQSPC